MQDIRPLIAGREDQLSPAIRRRLDVPEPSARDYMQALEDCERLRHDMVRYFTEFDLLLCPITVVVAHPHNSTELEVNGHKVPPRNALRAAIPFDLTGSPAISIPFGWSMDGLPIGIQLVARHFEEATLLHAASALEAIHGSETRRPSV